MKVIQNALLIFLSVCLMFSCENKRKAIPQEELNNKDTFVETTAVIDESALRKYFGTEHIKIDTVGRTTIVSVSGSQLLLSKKRKMGLRWESPEPWASVAATFQGKTLSAGTDSLIYDVMMEGDKYRFSYSTRQLREANRYLSVCEAFVINLNYKDHIAMKKMFSKDINSKYNTIQIKTFIQSTFGEDHIARTELIGTKIVGTKYSFYINFWNTEHQVQTYVFSFLEGDDRIAGVQIAK